MANNDLTALLGLGALAGLGFVLLKKDDWGKGISSWAGEQKSGLDKWVDQSTKVVQDIKTGTGISGLEIGADQIIKGDYSGAAAGIHETVDKIPIVKDVASGVGNIGTGIDQALHGDWAGVTTGVQDFKDKIGIGSWKFPKLF